MEVSFDLTIAWALLLAFATFVYVVLDGFDLGIGILYPFFPEKSDRDLMMNSVAPVWDGNETWLILGGGGLFAAFPLAYAIILPAVYVPIIVMLLALIFRGVAFEFRWRSQRRFSARAWDMSFICGSVVAALMQGIILGTLLQGIEIDGRAYGGRRSRWGRAIGCHLLKPCHEPHRLVTEPGCWFFRFGHDHQYGGRSTGVCPCSGHQRGWGRGRVIRIE